MAEALVSPILEQLSAVVAQQVREEVSLVGDVKKQVDKLKSNLLSIQSVLEDADRKQVKDKAVRDWVDKLKDVCYDMDDVLDEWSTAILRWKMEEAEENIRSRQKMRCVVQRRDIALKINEVCEKVDGIAKERALYGFDLYRATDELQRPRSTSLVDESSVIGRDAEKKTVVSKLLAESSQEARGADVISLVGLSGIGKTTLAQLAFNDYEVRAHFDIWIWVCVSDLFDEVIIAKAILEQLEGRPTNVVGLQSLLQGVSESIKGKRFLLVLDDVWTENHGQWEQLKPSLTGCARGSRILVTTRKDAVATMMGTSHRINIEELSDEICRSIFNHVAFQERSKDERERLTDIGDKIANKCKGLPLAAKVLGGLMQSKITREEWERVLSSELWRLDEVDRDQVERRIFIPLLLSYYDLPSVVRQCFLYCAMLPKDYEMRKDELVKMWMAQGYLKETSGGDMELVGEQYFQVLAGSSFFRDFETDKFEGMKFEMHDIVHDFAQYMTKNECLTVDASKLGEATMETSIERVRHLSMMLSEETSFPVSIRKAKGLRSLLIDARDPSLGAALPDLFKQLTCIRSLNLARSSIKEIPNEVGELMHLRHLNLASCMVLESLPETMCDLCNLQSLDVTRCRSLKQLPKAIGKLIKLRHLQIYGSGVAFIPKGIERITCLRTLDWFTVCGGGENESKAANLRELKNLNHIGGSLKIWNLQDASDAAEAQLKNKKRLLCLEMNFYYNQENGILIEALQPPSGLEYLTICWYRGLELPNWMMTLTRLQVLTLRYCENVEVLPPLGRLPNLESLELRSLKLRRLDAGFLGIEKDENASINEGEIARVTAFPKLKKLEIWNLKEVEEWDGIERRSVGEEDANTTSISIMPQLRQLTIRNCPLLRALPDYVLAAPLQELHIRSCPNLRERYGKEEMGEDWQKISHIPNIRFDD
ncbi:putative disease resistance protein RGA3 [Populus alba]|uniref:putative disease resistance protein RGA3 n=1 Tax=Populus alba TaxID=43335 RepID=UPI001589D5B4|nr:putative disease resistance protein RGA3 isoform X1 [Populus alba]XP_034929783.1 putative disease resistance protein RGA3 isoform X1 [Populus alba]XP_034929784.1 putative disease resistance protein RGA3 isoform X1 [Populus alba]XP_034929785.1 putative disease resistance protein RGA3 isoform X1 [Populus alba]